jgi:hypothetical protein
MIKRYNHLSFEEMLTAVSLKSLAWESDGYVLHTHNYGSSPHFRSVGELRLWIEKDLGWQLEAYNRRNNK